jgi:TonB family protein
MLLKALPTGGPDAVCRRLECWYYRLAFDPVVGGRRLAGGGAFTVIVLMDGSIVEPRVESAAAPAMAAPTAPVSATGRGAESGKVYRPNDAGVVPPRLLSQVRPQYTAAALKAKIRGSVLLEGVVRPDGTVSDVRVLRSLDVVYGLDEEAVKAFRQARFTPGTRSGQPVPVVVAFESTFTVK